MNPTVILGLDHGPHHGLRRPVLRRGVEALMLVLAVHHMVETLP
jgi:hypothetical protein